MSNNYTMPVILGNLAAGNQPLSDLDEDFSSVAEMGTLGCTASGTNAIALSGISGQPTLVVYGNYQKVSFVAANTTTGAVTITANSLGALNAYDSTGTNQLGSGSLIAGNYYEFAYNSTLNSSAGGWQLCTSSNSPSANIGTLTVTGTSHLEGNVGIGAAPSGYALDVVQSSSQIGYFGSTGSHVATVTIDNQAGGQGSALLFANSGANKWNMGITAGNAFFLTDAVGSPEFISATTGGNLALGPFQNFTLLQSGATALALPNSGVTGITIQNTSGTVTYTAMQFNTNGSGIGVGNISVSASATAYNTSSDKRLKEKPELISEAGHIIDTLQPVKFNWKSDGSVGYGVLAQDAHEAFPPAVTIGATEEDMWQVDYSKYVPLLLAELQFVRKRLAVLEAKS